MKDAITSFTGEYHFLSNMEPCYLVYKRIWFSCSESAFQAEKEPTPEVFTRFSQYDGYTAKAKGKLLILRPDWNKVKDSIMYNIVYEKYKQNPGLLEKLLDTGDKYLIEGNTWNDTYWGVYKGKGKINLGILQ